jgi:hypothetical protein
LIELEQDSPNQPTWQTIVHLLVGLLIVYVAARPVIHALHRHFFLESDSVAYIGLGTNLWHGRGFTDFAGNWCSDWPPLYPFFIGLSELLARNEVLAVGIVGGLCFAATILFAYIWLGRLTRSLFVRVVVTVMLALSVPLTNLANSGLSEILFVPLSVASMYFTAAYLDRGLRRNLLLSAFIALLCCLARYIGIAMIAAALIAILISPKQTIKRRLSDSGIFLIISVVPFAGWCAINHWINGDWMGQRIPGDHTFRECWIALITCLQNTLVQDCFSIILAFASLAGLVSLVITRKKDYLPYLSVALYFVVFYASLLVWSSATYSIDMVDDRLTYPLFVPLILICVGLIECLRTAIWRPAAIALTAAFGLLFGWIILDSTATAQIPDGGYLSSDWSESGVLSYVKDNEFKEKLYTNDSSAIYLFSDKGAECIADQTDSPTMPYVESVFDSLPNQSYIVWLYNGLEPNNFSANAIRSKCNLRIVAKFDDGVIFQRKGSGQETASSM